MFFGQTEVLTYNCVTQISIPTYIQTRVDNMFSIVFLYYRSRGGLQRPNRSLFQTIPVGAFQKSHCSIQCVVYNKRWLHNIHFVKTCKKQSARWGSTMPWGTLWLLINSVYSYLFKNRNKLNNCVVLLSHENAPPLTGKKREITWKFRILQLKA